jgi:hypothetical protein
MNSIQQDLESLGETSDQVADKLRELGIKGDRFSPTSCPIYNYLCKQGHDTVCSVDYSRTREAVAVKTNIWNASYGEDDSIKEYFRIRPVLDFIMAFDLGKQYPDLVSPSCKR